MTIKGFMDRIASKWLQWRTDSNIKQAIADGIMEDAQLKRFTATGKDVDILLMHPAVAAIAEQSVSFLNAHNAANYVQFDMMPRIDRGVRPVRITVQWANGMSPSEKATKVAAELARLRDRIQADKIVEYAGLLAYRDGNDQCSIVELARWIETGEGDEWLTEQPARETEPGREHWQTKEAHR